MLPALGVSTDEFVVSGRDIRSRVVFGSRGLALLHEELRYLPRCETNIDCQYIKMSPFSTAPLSLSDSSGADKGGYGPAQ